ncbi:hypothetical protein [Leptotrichia wadei]|jgi:hypothetical protein cdivTM_04845|uniref:Uncharacterized protein n=1 Tax=Leptotrichia wadei TaxID=157687 RepID=A0A510KVN7_9FUSO|nr:hypothetical protein [Leptotrichia wadei]MBS6019538.1 hypothetical protein [Leptotrichia wadei]BBM55770.1 hypothetical protein JMUB3936_2077 [Leptotrichia wadei]VTX68212.1 Uncharacterised protein [uncultured Leptotrichia sp.]
MNIRNLIKKMILIFGVIGISLTAFAAPRRNNKVVYVKKEPTRKIVRRRYIFVKVPKKKNSKVVYVKKEPTRRQRAAARARAARRR